jgi:hypothetical protein
MSGPGEDVAKAEGSGVALQLHRRPSEKRLPSLRRSVRIQPRKPAFFFVRYKDTAENAD